MKDPKFVEAVNLLRAVIAVNRNSLFDDLNPRGIDYLIKLGNPIRRSDWINIAVNDLEDKLHIPLTQLNAHPFGSLLLVAPDYKGQIPKRNFRFQANEWDPADWNPFNSAVSAPTPVTQALDCPDCKGKKVIEGFREVYSCRRCA